MPLADYAHWNEEAERVWWEEEGRHADEPSEPDGDDVDYGAADAFAEDIAEYNDEELLTLAADAAYFARWPQARAVVTYELRERGL